MKVSVIVVCITSAAICSCTSNTSQNNVEDSPPVSNAPQTSGQSQDTNQTGVIGHLEFQDKLVTIISTADGPRYTVATKDGKILATQLSEHQLQAKFPDVHQTMKKGIADDDASLRLHE